MKRRGKDYETPVEGWQGDRIETESGLQDDYGLANKKEVWKAQSQVRKFRRQARKLNAEEDEAMEQELIEKLVALDILDEGAGLNDVLDVTVEDILDRRLQTVVYRRGLADTVDEARQMVVHGHITLDGREITIPGYLVTEDEETSIKISQGSESMVEA